MGVERGTGESMTRGLDATIGAQMGDVADHLLLNRYSCSRAPEPFLELVRRHTGLVYGTCLRITTNVHDAEELTQECFFDLARQAGDIRTSLVGWLYQAATHLALNRIRGERRRRAHEQRAGLERVNLTPEATRSPADLSWNEISPLVDQALAELPESLRTPILMRYLEGATQADVANSLGVHQSTVSRRLSEGIESLREALRRQGVIVPMTALVTWFAAQSTMAAPPTLVTSIGKIGVAGVGTSMAANASGSSLTAWLAGVAKGAVALLFVPVTAGILWGEVVFLVVLAAWCGYLGLRQPEWVRVLCFTRQFPNIYEWPFFPFTRWTWQTPPREWRIWMAVYFVTGIELLGLIALPIDVPKRGGLLLFAAALWHIFMGARIWRRVRRCRVEFSASPIEAELPVDGALLLTYALAGVVLIAKLCASPWFLSQPENGTGRFSLTVACAIFWGTVLIWGTILVLGRYRRWRKQGDIDPVLSKWISDLAPPRWLLSVLMVVPLAIAFLITFVTLTYDVLPVYVPLGDNAIAVARRTMFTMTLSAMDFVVVAILPLAYLYRRIPKIAWGVAFGLVGLIGTLHLGLFVKTIVAAPVLAAPPMYEQPPRMELSEGHFVVENPPNLLANDTDPNAKYLGGSSILSVRIATAATIAVEYEGHKAQLSIPKNSDRSESEVSVAVMVGPHDFQKGIPSQIQVSLIVVHAVRRVHELEQFLLPLPADISPSDWKAQLEFSEQEHEKEYPLGETVILGTVQGKSVTIKVIADQTETEPAR